jgi:type IV pilus assembly protein PilV
MKRRAGFTLLEVMMALAVIAIGGSALIAMQVVTARSNTWSRNMMVATDVAQTWADRLKVDAVSWTDRNGFIGTTWLADSATVGQWMNPSVAQINVAPTPSRSFSFDRYGRDLPIGDATMFFCMGYRFTNVTVDATPAPTALRVDITVFWPRDDTGTMPSCALNVVTGPNQQFFRSVTLPVVLKRTVLPPL